MMVASPLEYSVDMGSCAEGFSGSATRAAVARIGVGGRRGVGHYDSDLRMWVGPLESLYLQIVQQVRNSGS